MFATAVGVQAVDSYGAGAGGGSYGDRAEQVGYRAGDIEPGGALVDCGAAGRVTELTCRGYKATLAAFPVFDKPGWRGCYRAGPPDHGTGMACDFMTNVAGSSGTARQNAVGFELSRWLMRNHQRMGVKYVIWHQRIWEPTDGDPVCVDETDADSFAQSCWHLMEDRGSNTQNHYDHVHVSFRY
ncbi:hypothetical protein FZ103_17425 [Streptomonospora sp. PA3]|uniref:hypothetical protein n=1 Tax=Streptomonospora sp. PA3 TaxID=2607326 RepID=UPI0012DEA534|nr:hypothetical protein [Streptomonospora sp. PA3]MUL42926.1 hypothetical protein [Streptomonospora sp. PA3]